jgi:hypothetical protein
MHRLALFAAILIVAVFAATARATGPIQDTLSAAGTDFAPAGTICNFNYELDFQVTIDRKRFFDENGVLLRRLQIIEEHLTHRNADTGFQLVEVTHYTTDLDVATGLVRLTGNSWHLRTIDGELVVVRSGLEIFDRVTGELFKATPRVGAGFANVICPALGGAPA